MSENWKPGDVAMVRVGTGDWEYGIRREDDTWGCQHTLNGFHDHDVQAHRLVVIDPEDREQVERLSAGLTEAAGWHAEMEPERTDCLQAALREFANPTPPRPDEPTGLGAVVEDDRGGLWVRTADSRFPWRIDYSADNGAESTVWEFIKAVRVLSEGVTP